VRASVRNKQPLVTYKPNATAARQIKEIAAKLAGEEVKASSDSTRLSQLIFGWLR
jgi:MinD-like ATPase involved in chromosome partitioning or flagellar assembly